MVQKLKIKKGDEVIVRTGRDAGKKGSVIRVFPKESRLLIQGINLVKRHTKLGLESKGGITTKEASIHVSNVALIDPGSNKATRVGYKILEDGSKVRFAKVSGEILDR